MARRESRWREVDDEARGVSIDSITQRRESTWILEIEERGWNQAARRLLDRGARWHGSLTLALALALALALP